MRSPVQSYDRQVCSGILIDINNAKYSVTGPCVHNHIQRCGCWTRLYDQNVPHKSSLVYARMGLHRNMLTKLQLLKLEKENAPFSQNHGKRPHRICAAKHASLLSNNAWQQSLKNQSCTNIYHLPDCYTVYTYSRLYIGDGYQ